MAEIKFSIVDPKFLNPIMEDKNFLQGAFKNMLYRVVESQFSRFEAEEVKIIHTPMSGYHYYISDSCLQRVKTVFEQQRFDDDLASSFRGITSQIKCYYRTFIIQISLENLGLIYNNLHTCY